MMQAMRGTPGWLTPSEAGLLYRLSGNVGNGRVVELGAYQGRSTIVLAAARASRDLSPILTVDTFHGSPENQPGARHHDPSLLDAEGRVDTLPAFLSNIDRHDLTPGIEIWRMTTAEGAAQFKGQIGLLFVDADHSYAGVDADLRAWLPYVLPGGVVVLHDVGDWPGPTRAAADLLERGYRRVEQQDTALALQRPAGQP
jgi:predicted O-methyltransferase YrrM